VSNRGRDCHSVHYEAPGSDPKGSEMTRFPLIQALAQLMLK